MRQLNSNPHFKTHADNIAQIIAAADNIAEADLRVGYYMMVVGVTYDRPQYEEALPRKEINVEDIRVTMPAANFMRIMAAPPYVPVDIPQPGEAADRPAPFERFELDSANVAAVLSENLPGVPYKMVPGVPMPSDAIPEPTPRKLDPGYDF